ncbi:type II toxin-antitoxin system VapC family toxin [Ottowia sp.]|mgnify:CR=1 FL=1|jgi:predicted nucleic acid-binding protein|uniref:type II toxin-antitoxin system VapC family toxin n=1 Tax=Ottowia sp. TaxID=1898956 RepID=UPI0025DD2146|nr:type II toxin-antitoxin system VapC family toxin [Ottowia sp.]MBK6612791.1 type II toxin-antitoxin system VapC family toxin [Ottowia sp.]
MVKALFDTNVLIDYLNGIDAADQELSRYPGKVISVITWMEVLAGAAPEEQGAVRAWLLSFEVMALGGAVAERAVAIRKARRIRLPDAIIWATAQVHSMLLVSRNTKDFPETEPGVRVPYVLPRH